mgnify:FL=1
MNQQPLHNYGVSLHEEPGDKFRSHFFCRAEDPEHAAEQAENAYPGCEILVVFPVEKEYRVRWEIDILASSPQEAAQIALTIQRDPESCALVFEVLQDGLQTPVAVDLYNAIGQRGAACGASDAPEGYTS